MKLNRFFKTVIILSFVLLTAITFVGCITYLYLSSLEFDYIIDENTVTITGIGTDDSVLVIPESIDGYPVTAIGDYAFKDNKNLGQIKLPNTLSYIGKGAFDNCSELLFVFGLEECTNLTSIEDETFQNCHTLLNLSLPNNITSIGNSAFKSCRNLRKVLIPESVSFIGKHAFDNCQSVESLIIPQGVTKIEEGTFFSCLKLQNITLPEGITEIDSCAFANCYELESVVLPSTVQVIGSSAFTTCKSLSSITIPEGVKTIYDFAFIECLSLKEITFPASVEYLGNELFSYDVALENVCVDSKNQVYTSINGVLYDKNVAKLISYPAGKKDKAFSLPETVVSIGDGAFVCNTNLESINIPKNVLSIGKGILIYTSLQIVNYSGSIQEWIEISKSYDWNRDSSSFIIYCTNGQIAKDGTVTYN